MAGRTADPLAALRTRSETQIIRAILAALRSVPGVVAWRQNTGAVTVPARAGQARRFVRYGELGMADIIGWRATYSDDGVQPFGDRLAPRSTPIAQFLALEVKRPSKHVVKNVTPEQSAFLNRVRAAGGIAAVVTSVDEALAAFRGGP